MTAAALPPGSGSRLLQSLAFIRDPTRFFLEQREKHGPIFTANLPVGDTVITGDPAGLKELFGADPDLFDVLSELPLIPVVGETSLLVTAGSAHRRKRKLLMPPLHGDRLRAYGQRMQELALEAMTTQAPGTRFRALDVTTNLSLAVIIGTVFGITEPERAGRFRTVLNAYMESYTPLLAGFTPLRRNFGGFGPWARFQRNVTALHGLLDEEIAVRRARGEDRQDILSLLLAARDEDGAPMSDVEIKDELRSLLIAGHETVAIALAWALHHLARAPEHLRTLREELDALGAPPSPEALGKAPFLTAVCDETLRLHPVATVAGRRTRAPFTLQGFSLPIGTPIMAAICLTHAAPELFDDPERFDPGRFLGRRYDPFVYLPFGGGARRCIGAAFAAHELRVILGTLIATRSFRADGVAPEVPVRRNVTMAPSRGVSLFDDGPRARAG